MNINEFITEDLIKHLKELCPKFGAIHKSIPIKKYGIIEGYLVWDYVLWNEISYITADGNTIQRLFTSTSDEQTEKEFERLSLDFTK